MISGNNLLYQKNLDLWRLEAPRNQQFSISKTQTGSRIQGPGASELGGGGGVVRVGLETGRWVESLREEEEEWTRKPWGLGSRLHRGHKWEWNDNQGWSHRKPVYWTQCHHLPRPPSIFGWKKCWRKLKFPQFPPLTPSRNVESNLTGKRSSSREKNATKSSICLPVQRLWHSPPVFKPTVMLNSFK